MRLSPIQLLESGIERIFVERVRDDAKDQSMLVNLDFQVFKEIRAFPDFWNEEPEPATLRDRTFRVTLGLRTPPEKHFQKYRFELVVSGVLMAMPESFRGRSVQDMVLEYGLTLLYGIAREQLAATSARMLNGTCTLPTMSFLGEAKAVSVSQS